MKFHPLVWLLSTFILFTATASAEDWTDEFADAVKGGEFNLNFRYRYEFVDQDGFDKDANASTLRTRLVYKTGEFHNFSAIINMDDLRPIVGSDYNSTRNGKTQYPLVPDPKATSLNLAAISYTGLENTEIVLGRQRIIRGNHRFIGNVGWRQNEQTYDAIAGTYKFLEKGEVFVSYVDRVKRVFGPDDADPPNPVFESDFRSDSFLFDAGYTFNPLIAVTGYAYLLDLENADPLSSETFGIRLSGGQDIGSDWKVAYVGEYASQEDYGDNPNDYDADYYLVEAGFNWTKFGLKAGYEVLEGNGIAGESFLTPLATLHKFNGWADKFLATPPDGLEDLYIEASANILKGNMSLVYHDFSADNGSSDYGDEIDFVAKWGFGKYYSVLAKFALYSGDSEAPITFLQADVDKYWVMLTAAF